MSPDTTLTNETLSSREGVLATVRQIISESTGTPVEQLDERRTLIRELSWDSLDKVECAMEIEEQFDITMPEDILDDAESLGDLVDAVMRLLGSPAS
jgi:acyl carrier protein